jgi:hypothetical protein
LALHAKPHRSTIIIMLTTWLRKTARSSHEPPVRLGLWCIISPATSPCVRPGDRTAKDGMRCSITLWRRLIGRGKWIEISLPATHLLLALSHVSISGCISLGLLPVAPHYS